MKLSNNKGLEQQYTDEDLVCIYLKTGDQYYGNILYTRYRNKVFASCFKFFKDRQISNDITQDVFLKVFTSLHNFNNHSRFSTWLYAITSNHCKDIVRKKKINHTELLHGNDDDFGNNYEIGNGCDTDNSTTSHDKIWLLQQSMKGLNEKERELLYCKYYDGDTIQELAAALGTTESAIKMQLLRARTKAKRILLSHKTQI